MAAPNAKQWVDVENGLVDRIIFSDPEIYRLEMECIFARAWCFVCHESQIPSPGDFFQNRIGEDRVIAVRNEAGAVSVFLDTCRHRGNAGDMAFFDDDKALLAARVKKLRTGYAWAEDGRRLDRLRRVDGELRIARRHVFLEQTLILSRNLSNFF